MKQTPFFVNGIADSRLFIESLIRIGVIVLLFVYCFMILKPFLVIMVWGLVITIVLYPLYSKFELWTKGRRRLSALIVILLLLAVLVIPIYFLGDSMAAGIKYLVSIAKEEQIDIPPPPPEVQSWPIVGKTISSFWQEASDDVEELIFKYQPELRSFLTWFISKVTAAGFGFFKFLISIILAGFFLAYSESVRNAFISISKRLAGDKGMEYIEMIRGTVRNVALGIIGVSMLQATLAGLGFLVAGVPGAGLWALIAFVLSVIQIGIIPVVILVLIYVFFSSGTLTFILLLLWSIPILLLDNILKPIIFGRKAMVPMLVVFIGAIGGFLASGILGLFLGAIVLSIGYKLFQIWLTEEESQPGVNLQP
jgi:predicted PurR-regulated permease PerM